MSSVKKNTRQTLYLPSVFLTLGKPPLYRVFFFPSVFSAALGKELVCRVSERIHSANTKTLGKFDISGSATSLVYFYNSELEANPIYNMLSPQTNTTLDPCSSSDAPALHSTTDISATPALTNVIVAQAQDGEEVVAVVTGGSQQLISGVAALFSKPPEPVLQQ